MLTRIIVGQLSRLVKRRSLIVLSLVILLLLLALGILWEQVDARAGVDAARSADAIIVLGCSVWPNEQPSPALAARTQHALVLYRAGYASHLIFTGGVGQYAPAEAEVMRRLAIAAGIPADAMLLEDKSHSTIENLANAKQLMQARGWHTAVIVSDPFHLLRAETIARDLGMEAFGSPAMESPTYTEWRLRVWYTTREALVLAWYRITRLTGEPIWLYGWLKGRIQDIRHRPLAISTGH